MKITHYETTIVELEKALELAGENVIEMEDATKKQFIIILTKEQAKMLK